MNNTKIILFKYTTQEGPIIQIYKYHSHLVNISYWYIEMFDDYYWTMLEYSKINWDHIKQFYFEFSKETQDIVNKKLEIALIFQ